jgi:ABC-2 type transport system permease protein
MAALAALRLGARQMLAGWPVLIGRCLFYVLIMVVISALWTRVAAEGASGGLASTAPVARFAFYVGVTEWITLSLPALHMRLEDDIRRGGLEAHLLRPKAYLIQTWSHALGSGLVRMAALGVTGLALLRASGQAAPSLAAWIYIVVLGVLGLMVGVLLYTLAGLGAFWARRVLPFQLVIQKLMFLMGGLFAPVSLYPQAFAKASEASPFAAHLYWAGRQAISPSASLFLQGIGWQLLWIALLAAVSVAIWRAGLRKLLREGG